mgnify:CR=1 FL=1
MIQMSDISMISSLQVNEEYAEKHKDNLVVSFKIKASVIASEAKQSPSENFMKNSK